MLTAAYLVTKQNPESIWAASIEAPPIAIHPGSRGSSTAFQAPTACHLVIDSVPVGACSRPRAKLSCKKAALQDRSLEDWQYSSLRLPVDQASGSGRSRTRVCRNDYGVLDY